MPQNKETLGKEIPQKTLYYMTEMLVWFDEARRRPESGSVSHFRGNADLVHVVMFTMFFRRPFPQKLCMLEIPTELRMPVLRMQRRLRVAVSVIQ